MSPRYTIVLILLTALWAPAQAEPGADKPVPPITEVQQVRYLTLLPVGTAQGRPVRLTGVVTHVNGGNNSFYLQDDSAGILILPSALGQGLTPGDRVEVEGATQTGEFAPNVLPRSVKRLGKGVLPTPMPYDLSIENSRWLDGQWIQGWAVIQEARTEKGMTYLDVIVPRAPLEANNVLASLVVPGEWGRKAQQMRKHAVVFTGVCVATFQNRLVNGPPQILLSQLPELPPVPIEPPGGAQAPPRIIDTLLSFAPDPHPGARQVKIAGVVTAVPLPEVVAIQDPSGGATIFLQDGPAPIAIGTRVEAYGYLHVNRRHVYLTQATIKELGVQAMPEPLEVTAHELPTGVRDGFRVRLSGRIEEARDVDGWTAVTLIDDAARFQAFLPGSRADNKLENVEIGSHLEVVGVPLDVTPDRRAPAVPGVFLTDRDALKIVGPPLQQQGVAQSWWKSDGARISLGGLLAALLLVGSWLAALQIRVRRATSEMKRQFEEKAEMEMRLLQNSKLEAVGRLAGGIAHDFNNMLTVINGCAELLAEESSRDGGRLLGLTREIQSAGERAATLTGQLLTFSRKREVTITAVDLNASVRDSIRLLERLIGENIRIETSLASDLPPVKGEPGFLNQVVMNVALNARDAMPDGGVLKLSTALLVENMESEPGRTRQIVRLTISDTGVGMTEKVKARIFEPFFTTKPAGGGTGLGLATVKNIMQTINGRIRVDSEIGHGTSFHLDFRIQGEPVSDAELALPSTPTPFPPTRGASRPKLAGVTVLLVEDDEMVRDTLAAGLKCDGARVLAADGPGCALSILAEHEGPLDVLVTDVMMPLMNGPTLAARVRERCPDVRIVYMSGYTADIVLGQGVQEDEVEFLQKPFTPENLTRRLKRLMENDGRPV